MITRPLGKNDYDHIVQIIDRWWGGPSTALAHPLFFYELGQMARVVEHEGVVAGFLLGFVAPGPPKEGYVHLVGIHFGDAESVRCFTNPSRKMREVPVASASRRSHLSATMARSRSTAPWVGP